MAKKTKKEFDLKVYDIFQTPYGNLFLKVDHQHSLPLGPYGHHGPSSDTDLDIPYMKINAIVDVIKVGELKFKKKFLKKLKVESYEQV